MDTIIDVMGYSSSVILTVMFAPQIFKVYKSKETKALSYAFLLCNNTSSALGFTYACYYYVWPMMIANFSACISSAVLGILKYKNESVVL